MLEISLKYWSMEIGRYGEREEYKDIDIHIVGVSL